MRLQEAAGKAVGAPSRLFLKEALVSQVLWLLLQVGGQVMRVLAAERESDARSEISFSSKCRKTTKRGSRIAILTRQTLHNVSAQLDESQEKGSEARQEGHEVSKSKAYIHSIIDILELSVLVLHGSVPLLRGLGGKPSSEFNFKQERTR